MKINLGCGKRNFGKDWIHIDGGDYEHLHSKDIRKLSFEDGVAGLIYASHIIEYFDREEIVPILKEWHRVLKPDGILQLAVPDFAVMAKLYDSGNYKLENFLGPLYGRMLMGNSVIYHRTVYDFYCLKRLLLEVGYKNVKRYDWRETNHSHYDDHSQAYLPHMDKNNGILISLNVECTK
tara:strand:+ start:11535 stop:12071 length:537 start_codon:yes stop_codon:yes gene_type:complete